MLFDVQAKHRTWLIIAAWGIYSHFDNYIIYIHARMCVSETH